MKVLNNRARVPMVKKFYFVDNSFSLFLEVIWNVFFKGENYNKTLTTEESSGGHTGVFGTTWATL